MKKSRSSIIRAGLIGIVFFSLNSCSNDDGCTTQTFYLDKDLDGFGGSESTLACKAPNASIGQYVTLGGDTNDNDANINPGCDLVFYVDSDNDGFGVGDPILFCENPDEDKYTDNDTAFDCDDTDASINPDVLITYYPDSDNDGYGDPDGQTTSLSVCKPSPEGFVENSDDCDDTNANINPEITEIPNDDIDNNCDGADLTIWTGPDFQFNKPDNADWEAGGENVWDMLTDNVTLTRTTNGYITNIAWWYNVVGVVPNINEDLLWEYRGRRSNGPVTNVGTAKPAGGPQGVRWAILEQGGETNAWDSFNLYGTLGDPTNFYSLNNIVSICDILDSNIDFIRIIDEFGIEGDGEEYRDFDSSMFQFLAGKRLGVWLVEEDIYFTLTFDAIPQNGGEMKYTRSTPSNN